MKKKIIHLEILQFFWSKVESWIISNFNALFENDKVFEDNISNLNDNKYDKTGGTIKGNVTVTGTATFKNKVTLPEGGNVGTVLDIPGNLGIGSKTNSEVTGRIITYRKVNNPAHLVATKSSIGYNPIVNTAAQHDYGMKYQVQYDSGVDSYDGCCFYLSYSGCIVGFSGDPSKRISKFYNVLHEGNSYNKEDIDTMINTLKIQNAELKQTCDILYAALESLGVDLNSIETSYSEKQSRMVDVIDMIQNKPKGFDVPDDYVFEQ